jgi:hypothetical protein
MAEDQNKNQTIVGGTQVQSVVQTASASQVQPVIPVEEKKVFVADQEVKAVAPEWLKEASEAKAEQKVQPVQDDETAKMLPNFRAEKPDFTDMEGPIKLKGVMPSWGVVKKADEEASVKMTDANYDPKTGKKVEEQKSIESEKATLSEPVSSVPAAAETKGAAGTKVASADAKAPAAAPADSQKKKSIFDNVKSLFAFNAHKNSNAVEKIDQAALDKKTGVKISQVERQKYMDEEKIYRDGLASIKDLISPSAMEINYDFIRVDGMYARSFYVYAYPRYLDINWLAPVVNFDVTMDISQFIYPISSESIMRILKKKVAQMQSSMRINADKGQVRDPALETALEDAEQLRTDIQRGQEKFFQFSLYFTVYSDDDKKLDRIAKQLESLLAGKLVLTKRCQLQAEHAFNSTLPMALDELYIIRNMNTSPLATTFPFSSSDLTSDKGILYGINRHNDSLIIFDRFALENANSVVFAKSGAGKSYAVKLEVLRMMMMGTDVIVIDPENEYEALANTIGGTYLKLSLNSDRRINPFDLPKPIEGEDANPGDLLRSNIINLHGLLKLMLGGLTPEEEGIMDKALIDVYALKGITMELKDPSVYEPPTMEDLNNILNSMESASGLAQRISQYTVGSYSGIFNKQTNVNLQNGLMIFCIRDLEDSLRPIAMYIILNYIWNKVRSELRKRVLVVDEAWSMMQHEDSAKFLFGLVKRARKYYLGVTTITQDVEDFIKSEYGKPIITNSSMQLLLKQAPSAIEILGKIFNLTQGEKYVLLNSDVGQGLFFAGLKHVAVQIIASYTENKIVTTNPEEVLSARGLKTPAA